MDPLCAQMNNEASNLRISYPGKRSTLAEQIQEIRPRHFASVTNPATQTVHSCIRASESD